MQNAKAKLEISFLICDTNILIFLFLFLFLIFGFDCHFLFLFLGFLCFGFFALSLFCGRVCHSLGFADIYQIV